MVLTFHWITALLTTAHFSFQLGTRIRTDFSTKTGEEIYPPVVVTLTLGAGMWTLTVFLDRGLHLWPQKGK